MLLGLVTMLQLDTWQLICRTILTFFQSLKLWLGTGAEQEANSLCQVMK